MLVLSRRKGERIRIGEGIVVTILDSAKSQIRLGIEAPDNVEVHREEVWKKVREFRSLKPAREVGRR